MAFDAVSFHTEGGEWIPTSLSMYSLYKPSSVRLTVPLAEQPTDLTLTQSDSFILFDFYDLGIRKADVARYRRLEATVSEFEAKTADMDADRIFWKVQDLGKKNLDIKFTEERRTEGGLLSSVFRLIVRDSLEWDLTALQADGERYLFFTASLYNRTHYVLTDSFVWQVAVMLGVVYTIMGAFLLISVWRLLKKNERLDAARRALTSAAAHELKTPLSVIQNQSEYVLENIDPARDREYVDSIHDEALRMSGIVNTLLQYNRLSNLRKIEKQPVDRTALIKAEIESYRAFAEAKGVNLRVRRIEHKPPLDDSFWLFRILRPCFAPAKRRSQNAKQLKNISSKGARQFFRDRFFQDNEAAAENTGVFSRLMRQDWKKSVLKNRFGFDSPHPTVTMPGTATVNGNEALLRLAVDNYLSNAIKYAKGEKTVRVSLITTKKRIRFETVNDCAPISKKDAKALWTLLAKRDKARSVDTGAAGMGLPLCAQIFRLHGYKYGCVPSGNSICFFFETAVAGKR